MLALLNGKQTTSLRIALFVTAGLTTLQVQANEALAGKSGCLGCHAVAVKLVGPAYKDVAANMRTKPMRKPCSCRASVTAALANGGSFPCRRIPKFRMPT